MISLLERIAPMRKQHNYGIRMEDNSYAFPVTFNHIRKKTISLLLFDDKDMEVTPDTWLTQTGAFIGNVRNSLGPLEASVISITPTNDPAYSLAFVVQYDKAHEVQEKTMSYIRSLSKTLEAD